MSRVTSKNVHVVQVEIDPDGAYGSIEFADLVWFVEEARRLGCTDRVRLLPVKGRPGMLEARSDGEQA